MSKKPIDRLMKISPRTLIKTTTIEIHSYTLTQKKHKSEESGKAIEKKSEESKCNMMAVITKSQSKHNGR